MTNDDDDYLWNPRAQYDPEVGELERKLRSLSADAERLKARTILPELRSATGGVWRVAAGIVAAVVIAGSALGFRLNWTNSAPWSVSIISADGKATDAMLHVDETVSTQPMQTLILDAARIGKIRVSPDSTIRLIETRKGHHRIELARGHLHAKVWAPPGYFGVVNGRSRFVDLGCEFDLEMDSQGSGYLSVESGFVIHTDDEHELLVPQGYHVEINRHRPMTPLRATASAEFKSLVMTMDRIATDPTTDADLTGLSNKIADLATDADYFTLLDVLVRHPSLAKTNIYPRLAAALKVTENDEEHRALWIQGDVAARDRWWRAIPQQPKAWWSHWQDAF